MPVKRLTGKIISAKMEKTVVVAIEMPKKHAIYEKQMKNTKKLKVRNEVGAEVGNVVIIEECRPLSKDVSWKVVQKA